MEAAVCGSYRLSTLRRISNDPSIFAFSVLQPYCRAKSPFVDDNAAIRLRLKQSYWLKYHSFDIHKWMKFFYILLYLDSFFLYARPEGSTSFIHVFSLYISQYNFHFYNLSEINCDSLWINKNLKKGNLFIKQKTPPHPYKIQIAILLLLSI